MSFVMNARNTWSGQAANIYIMEIHGKFEEQIESNDDLNEGLKNVYEWYDHLFTR